MRIDPGLSGGLAASGKCVTERRVSQRGIERAHPERPLRQLKRGRRRSALRRLQNRRARREARNQRRCEQTHSATLRATPLDALADHAFSAVDARGTSYSPMCSCSCPSKRSIAVRRGCTCSSNGVALSRQGVEPSPPRTCRARRTWSTAVRLPARTCTARHSVRLVRHAGARAAQSTRDTDVVGRFNGTLTGDALHAALDLTGRASPSAAKTDWHAVLRTVAGTGARTLPAGRRRASPDSS